MVIYVYIGIYNNIYREQNNNACAEIIKKLKLQNRKARRQGSTS